MSKIRSCISCEFWRVEPKVRKNKVVGQCKESGPRMGPNGMGYWPIIEQSEFCYKWESSLKGKLWDEGSG
ncbi:MAG: hypothetical protein KAS32_21990 [Candidatus Peribacteraceae bacterium]|nr:hypothetical protein [Candidatus Peribacteraceae bacterium]